MAIESDKCSVVDLPSAQYRGRSAVWDEVLNKVIAASDEGKAISVPSTNPKTDSCTAHTRAKMRGIRIHVRTCPGELKIWLNVNGKPFPANGGDLNGR